MKKLITLFLVVVSAATNAQSEGSYKEISFQDNKDIAKTAPYYIENVYDGRQFKDNIGTVQTGAFNKKTYAKTVKPLPRELMDYFTVVYPKSDGKKPLSIRVSEMYVSELTESFSETGYASVVLDVIETIDGTSYIVGRYSSSEEGNGMDVTGKHDNRLKSCISRCLQSYSETADSRKTRVLFEPNTSISQLLPTKIKKGIYYSYDDLLNNTPQDTINFNITGSQKKYLTHAVTGQILLDYYAISDGENVYVNVSKYAKDKYYSKVEVIGSKFFIEDVVFNKNTSVMWGAMFGLVGMLIAESSQDNEGSAPMFIDIITGKPTFLTNNTMKDLLEPYPALLKEYKKGGKSTAEKKALLGKVFQGSISE